MWTKVAFRRPYKPERTGRNWLLGIESQHRLAYLYQGSLQWGSLVPKAGTGIWMQMI